MMQPKLVVPEASDFARIAAEVIIQEIETAVETRGRCALALAGGSFIYLGFHAIHGEWRRGVPAFVPALTGAAGAAALQQGLRVFFR